MATTRRMFPTAPAGVTGPAALAVSAAARAAAPRASCRRSTSEIMFNRQDLAEAAAGLLKVTVA